MHETPRVETHVYKDVLSGTVKRECGKFSVGKMV